MHLHPPLSIPAVYKTINTGLYTKGKNLSAYYPLLVTHLPLDFQTVALVQVWCILLALIAVLMSQV